MAYQRRFKSSGSGFNINTALQNPDFQKLLLDKIGQGSTEPKPQANFLDRLLALPSAIGSIPDVIASASNGDNPLTHYLENLRQGVEQTFTGNKVENFKTTSDLLDKAGILQGGDTLSKVLKGAAGFAGDVALDPTTYITFGTGGLAKGASEGAAKTIGEKIAEQGSGELLKNTGIDIAKVLSDGGAKAATNVLEQAGIQGAGDIVKLATRGLANKKTLEIAGKEVFKDLPAAAKIAETAINPLGSIVGMGKDIAKKVAPEATDEISKTVNRLFNASGSAEQLGYSTLRDKAKELPNLLEGSAVEQLDTHAKLLSDLSNTSPEFQKVVGDIFENTATPEEIAKVVTPETQGIMDQITQILTDRGSALQQAGKIPANKVALEGIENIPQHSGFLGKTVPGAVKQTGEIKAVESGIGTIFGSALNGSTKVRDPKQLFNIAMEQVDNLPKEKQAQAYQALLNIIPEGDVAKPGIDMLAKISNITKQAPTANDLSLIEEMLNLAPRTGTYFPRNATSYTEKFIRDKFGDSADAILNEPAIAKEIKNGAVDIKTLNNVIQSPRFSGGATNLKDFTPDSLLERTFDTAKAGKEAGVIYEQNPTKTLGKYLIDSDKAMKVQEFNKQIINTTDDYGAKIFKTAEDFGGKSIPPTFKAVDINGLDKQYFVPKDVSEIFQQFGNQFISDNGTNKLLDAYDTVLKKFKQSVTAYSPGLIAYNVRNGLDDATRMVIGGAGFRSGKFNPTEFAKSISDGYKVLDFQKLIRKVGKEEATKQMGDKFATYYDNIVAKGLNGVGTGQLANEAAVKSSDVALDLISKGESVQDKIKSTLDKVAIDPFRKREDAFRIANVIDHYKQTGSWADAAQKAAFSSFDYNNLTKFESKVMKRVIPFYSFMKNNIDFQLKTFASKPGVIMAQRKFFNNLGKTLSNGDMSQEDWGALPDWMKTGLSVVLGKQGQNVDILTGFGDSTSALNDQLSLDPATLAKNLISSSNPLIKMPIEIGTGQNVFTGQPIADSTEGRRYKDYPAWVKQAIGYKEIKAVDSKGNPYTNYRVNPNAAYLIENLPFISPWNTMTKRINDVTGSDGSAKYIINLLSGARVYSKNLDTEKAARQREKSDAISKTLTDTGIAQSQKGIYINPSLKENYPGLSDFLSQLGYNPKKTTKATKVQASNKKDAQVAYIQDLIDNL